MTHIRLNVLLWRRRRTLRICSSYTWGSYHHTKRKRNDKLNGREANMATHHCACVYFRPTKIVWRKHKILWRQAALRQHITEQTTTTKKTLFTQKTSFTWSQVMGNKKIPPKIYVDVHKFEDSFLVFYMLSCWHNNSFCKSCTELSATEKRARVTQWKVMCRNKKKKRKKRRRRQKKKRNAKKLRHRKSTACVYVSAYLLICACYTAVRHLMRWYLFYSM